nr:phage tail protein I [Pseudodesulfovibrio sp.]
MNKRMVDLLPSSLTADPVMLAAAEMLDTEFARIDALIPLVAPWVYLDKVFEPVLSYLAVECAVDVWEPDWSVEKKRSVLRSALSVHRKKGTAKAVKAGLEAMGFRARHLNWPEFDGDPYTFRVEVDVLDQPLTESALDQIGRSIEENKALRSHLDSLDIFLSVEGTSVMVNTLQVGQSIDIYPWQPDDVEIQTEVEFGGAVAVYNITEVGVAS